MKMKRKARTKECINCKYFKKSSVYTGITVGMYEDALKIANELGNIDIKFNNDMGYDLYDTGRDNTNTCSNKYSEYYEHGISKYNTCECYTDSKNKETKKKINVMDNYKCDGQLSFDIDGNIA